MANLLDAVKANKLNEIKYLLSNTDISQEELSTALIDNEGKTALMYAAKDSYNLEKIRLLIKAGAEINVSDNEGNTALGIARKAENTKTINLLTEAEAKD